MESILKLNPIDWVVFWVSIFAYAPLILGVMRQKHDTSQNFYIWGMYFVLDIITMASSVEQDGNFVLLFGFAVGSFILAAILIYQKRLHFGVLEILSLSLIATCMIIWVVYGPHFALVCGIISECILGIHLLVKTIIHPVVKYNLAGYSIFLLASVISLLGAENLSVEEIGYSLAETILCTATIIPLIIKWRRDKKRKRY